MPEAAALTKDEHQQLLDKISQLAQLRESNTMLRAQQQEMAAAATAANARAAELQAQLEPLQQREAQLLAEVRHHSSLLFLLIVLLAFILCV
jgi:uncharacterized protein involved in exopolysaccharide biosynthesis